MATQQPPPRKQAPPPSDPDAELGLIGALVMDQKGALIDEARRIVAAEHFYLDANKALFTAVCDLSDTQQPIDAVTLANHLRANNQWQRVGSQYLMKVLNECPAFSAATVRSYAEIVRDMYRTRQVIAQGNRIAHEGTSLAGADPSTIQSFLENAEQTFGDLAHTTQDSHLVPLSDILVEVQRNLSVASQQRTAVVGVPTGFGRLDALMTGLHDGDLSIVAARPGMGKTGFAGSMAVKVAKAGYAVAFMSMEMPAVQLAMRLVSAESGVDLTLLRTGQLGAAEWSRITTALGYLSALPIFIDDSADLTLLDIRANVRRLQRELDAGKYPACTQRRIGAVMVDYLQLIKPLERGRSREQEISEISRGLKSQAKSLNVPYVVLAQLNRESERREDHRPRLSDLRESGSIEADADNVMFIHRQEYYEEDPDEDVKGIADIVIAKQRNGPLGTVKVIFTARSAHFESLRGDEEAIEEDDLYEGFDAPEGGIT